MVKFALIKGYGCSAYKRHAHAARHACSRDVWEILEHVAQLYYVLQLLLELARGQRELAPARICLRRC